MECQLGKIFLLKLFCFTILPYCQECFAMRRLVTKLEINFPSTYLKLLNFTRFYECCHHFTIVKTIVGYLMSRRFFPRIIDHFYKCLKASSVYFCSSRKHHFLFGTRRELPRLPSP